MLGGKPGIDRECHDRQRGLGSGGERPAERECDGRRDERRRVARNVGGDGAWADVVHSHACGTPPAPQLVREDAQEQLGAAVARHRVTPRGVRRGRAQGGVGGYGVLAVLLRADHHDPRALEEHAVRAEQQRPVGGAEEVDAKRALKALLGRRAAAAHESGVVDKGRDTHAGVRELGRRALDRGEAREIKAADAEHVDLLGAQRRAAQVAKLAERGGGAPRDGGLQLAGGHRVPMRADEARAREREVAGNSAAQARRCAGHEHARPGERLIGAQLRRVRAHAGGIAPPDDERARE